MSPPCLTWQSEEVDRVESQVMHLRSQVVAELEAKLAKNHQKLAQFTTDMQIEVRPLHLLSLRRYCCFGAEITLRSSPVKAITGWGQGFYQTPLVSSKQSTYHTSESLLHVFCWTTA